MLRFSEFDEGKEEEEEESDFLLIENDQKGTHNPISLCIYTQGSY